MKELLCLFLLAVCTQQVEQEPKEQVARISALCPTVRDGFSLKAIVVQEDYKHYRWHSCYYGRLAGIKRQWEGL